MNQIRKARITNEGYANADENKELTVLQAKGAILHWPPVHRPSN